MKTSVWREGPGGSVSMVTIDNPPVNALDAQVREELVATFRSFASADSAVRVVVLRGANHRFCAGGDIREMDRRCGADDSRRLHASFAALYGAVRSCPVPVIAAVEGYAMGGGCELCLCCDLCYVTPDTRVAASGVNMGLVESAHTLPRAVLRMFAGEMLFTGDVIDGSEAARVGLATRCVPAAEFEAHVAGVAARIAGRAPGSVRAAKEILAIAMRDPDQAAGLAERRWLQLRAGSDHQEALAAFNERRPAIFGSGAEPW